MIVLLLLLASARAVTIISPAKWNIVDGVIPQGLDAEKGCHSGLRISETKPLASIPISCANIRYSVYDSSVATMGYDDVTIDRSYTERNVVSKDGVCKMQMSSMDSTTAADVYTKGQDMKFFSRYGYCDGTYTGTKHFGETTFESDRSCPEGSDTVEKITISGFVLGKVSIGGIPQDLILTDGVNYEFEYEDYWDTFVITSNNNPIGTRVGFVLSVSHTELKGTLEYYNTHIHYHKPNIVHMPITMVEPGYLFPIYTEEECAFYTGKNVSVISDMTQPYGCWSDGTFNEFNREVDLGSLEAEVQVAKAIRKQELLDELGELSGPSNAVNEVIKKLQLYDPGFSSDKWNSGDITYENPDLTLSEVDREKRVEARKLSWGNIRARETAIARALLNGNANVLVIDPLYESLVKLNHKCVNCQCYNMRYSMNNDKPKDIRADCKEQCVGHDGFLLYWDTSQQRVVSQRDRHRSSCVCAGDGEPVSALECVLYNREWISNEYTDQYELNAKDPTVKTGVQTKDVYLHCPGPMCSNGPTEGCWDDAGVWCDSGWFNNGCQEGCKPGFLEEDCSCGDSACKAGQYCTKDGVCKDVVKKEKKFLQIRYNSLD